MQHGFAAKKAKKAAKKKARKLKAKTLAAGKAADGDVDMGTAMNSSEGVDEELIQDDQEQQTGRAAHADKVALKRALKVRVASLKQNRIKVNKLPGAKNTKKELGKNIKALMVEHALVSGKNKGKTQAAPDAAAAGDAMAQ